MFNAEEYLTGLEAHELSELRDLINSDEYTRVIDDWEEVFAMNKDDD